MKSVLLLLTAFTTTAALRLPSTHPPPQSRRAALGAAFLAGAPAAAHAYGFASRPDRDFSGRTDQSSGPSLSDLLDAESAKTEASKPKAYSPASQADASDAVKRLRSQNAALEEKMAARDAVAIKRMEETEATLQREFEAIQASGVPECPDEKNFASGQTGVLSAKACARNRRRDGIAIDGGKKTGAFLVF